MDIKAYIKKRFGSIKAFAGLLGAPPRTVYSWTRKKDIRNPVEWQFKAYIDCAEYRERKSIGWRCKTCKAIVSDSGYGIVPRICVNCGSGHFNVVSLVDEENKGSENKEMKQ